MKAIQVHEFGGPEVLKLEDVPDPQPQHGQVVVRIKAIGVNPVETYLRSGIYGPRPFPYTPGSDAAGVVEAVGEGVTRFKAGDRVYTAGSVSGTYAELALCTEEQVHPLPQHVSVAQGAALGVPAATAYRALFQRGNAMGAETVLIHGATGGVGSCAVQMARAAGLIVIGTGGSEPGRSLLLDLGAHHVLDHTKDDYLKQAMQITGGRGIDLIIEMLANVNLAKDLEVLAKFGRVVVVGSRGEVEINPRDTMRNDADIRGMLLYSATPAELRSIHAAIGAMLENQTLRIVVGKELPLAEAARAHREIIDGKAMGKMVLVV